jgi:hypothetical protein
MGKVYQCWWRKCREIIFVFCSRFGYQKFYVLRPFMYDIFTDFPSYIPSSVALFSFLSWAKAEALHGLQVDAACSITQPGPQAYQHSP